MKKSSPKHKAYLRRKSVKGNAPKKKRRNRRGYNTSKNDTTSTKRRHTLLPKSISAPAVFKLDRGNCEDTVRYVNLLKAVATKYDYIEIDLSEVIEIGEGAISMLLSVIEDLGSNTRIQGTYPEEQKAKEILVKSGFFKYMAKVPKQESGHSRNTILTKGDFDTPPDEMAEEVRAAMETVWGTRGRNPLLYGGIFEMIRNSCDHAFRRTSQVRWYLSITHLEEENKVKFSFVDNGKGIINTLSKGKLRAVINFFRDNADILDSAFKNGIESRTGLSWRGKGLPTIYELIADNTVENLVVISNDIYLSFEGDYKAKLKSSYSGTYYYWEISQNCEKYCFK